MSVCKNCTRKISEAEIIKYFEGEGNDDLEQQINRINYDEPNYDYEPGDKINPVTLLLKNMKCPNCKNKLKNCPPFETKVDIEEEWFDDYGHGPDQSPSFCVGDRYTIIQEDRYPFLKKVNSWFWPGVKANSIGVRPLNSPPTVREASEGLLLIKTNPSAGSSVTSGTIKSSPAVIVSS